MRIQNVLSDSKNKSFSNSKNNNLRSQNFGHKIIIDIGASNKKGSLKLLALSDNGKQLFKTKGFVNDTIHGFKDNGDFLNKLSGIVKTAQTKIKDMTKAGQLKLKGKDKLLSGLAIFVPGTTFPKNGHDQIAIMPNLRDTEGKSLEYVDFADFENNLKQDKDDSGESLASKNFKLKVTKDLGGCGLALVKLLSKKGELNEGDYIMGIMTGGGFGSVDIKVKNSLVEFETSESSSYLSGNFESYDRVTKLLERVSASSNPSDEISELKANNSEKLAKETSILGKLGRQGVSVKSHIRTYFKALGLANLEQIALEAGDARIVEQNRMNLDKVKDVEIIDEIKKHKEFIFVSEKKDKMVYKLDENYVGADRMKKARDLAVNSYANAVSLITINKINDCVNKVILAGPFAHGVNSYIVEHPDDFNGAKTLPELIMQKVNKNISPEYADLPSTQRLLNLYKLQIICDPSLNFDDNTFAGELLLDKKLSFVENRGSWFSIPTQSLK